MKTSVILTRDMGEFKVLQRTSDEMFNATSLLKQWNAQSATERKMDNYFNLQGTKEFITTIMDKENLHTPRMVYVKSKASRGNSAGTWMSPLLFIDFAMYINPAFKYDVLKFVYDELVENRVSSGDEYRNLSLAVSTITNKKDIAAAMINLAKALNHVCFGEHEKDIRNKETSTSLKELSELEKEITLLINVGHIKTFEEIKGYLRVKWIKKYRPMIPLALN